MIVRININLIKSPYFCVPFVRIYWRGASFCAKTIPLETLKNVLDKYFLNTNPFAEIQYQLEEVNEIKLKFRSNQNKKDLFELLSIIEKLSGLEGVLLHVMNLPIKSGRMF